MLNEVIEKIFTFFGTMPLETILIIILSTFGGLSVLVLALTLSVGAVKRANKRPYLSLVNAFTALTLAAILLEYEIETAILFGVSLWFVGFLFYGILSALTPNSTPKVYAPAPVQINKIVRSNEDMSAPIPNVRLDHALAVSEKLLTKNLSRGDRMEVEKINFSLNTLSKKGEFTLDDGKILNDGFNALIKLMARYNL